MSQTGRTFTHVPFAQLPYDPLPGPTPIIIFSIFAVGFSVNGNVLGATHFESVVLGQIFELSSLEVN